MLEVLYDPQLDDLTLEQSYIQTGKRNFRTLGDYSSELFPVSPVDFGVTIGSVVDLLSDSVLDASLDAHDKKIAPFIGMLQGMFVAKGSTLHWVDMGSGYALAMREAASIPGIQDIADMTSVDVLELHTSQLAMDKTYRALFMNKEYLVDDQFQPRVVRENAESVQLQSPGDLITAIHVMEYLHDPLRALCNWYNQLSDDGILGITNSREWSDGIHIERGSISLHEPFLENLIAALRAQGLQVADDQPPILARTAIQKQPGTSLKLNASVIDGYNDNESDLRCVLYGNLPSSSEPIIELVRI